MSNDYSNTAKTAFCNTEGAYNVVGDTITGEESKNYTLNNYNQYCFNRLPCGVCTRTNQMCPFAGNSNNTEITPTCDPIKTPVNPITNPQVWYTTCTTDSSRNDPNINIEAKN